MNTVSVFAISTLLAASVSTIALAQDVNVDTGVGADTGAEIGTMDTRTDADAGAGMETGDIGGGAAADAVTEGSADDFATDDFAPENDLATDDFATEDEFATDPGEGANSAQVISSLRASGDGAAQIGALADSDRAEVVVLSDLHGDAMTDPAALDEAVAAQETSMDELRDAIEENAALSGALEADGYDSADVVAVTTGINGEVHLIVDG